MLTWMSACDSAAPDVSGAWQVENSFYKAIYQLELNEGMLTAMVLNYDDGTTRFVHQGGPGQYLFKDLQWKEGIYVDGMAGATARADSFEFSLQLQADHTLNVKRQISGKILEETWTRLINEKDRF